MRRSAATLVSAFAVTAFAISCLLSCQQLFTTSLASALARTSITLPATLSTSQASDLAAQAKADDDTKLASALVASLVKQIGSMPASDAKTSLETSAASAAITASGVGSVFTSLSSTDLTSITAGSAQSLLATLQAGATSDVLTALTYLDPATISSASSGLSSTDYLMAAVVVAASIVPKGATLSSEDSSTLEAADPTKYALAQALYGQAQLLAGGSNSLVSSLGSSFSL
jgi:hypothetical protein